MNLDMGFAGLVMILCVLVVAPIKVIVDWYKDRNKGDTDGK